MEHHGATYYWCTRFFVVKVFYCHNESYAETVRHHRWFTGRNYPPKESTVRRLTTKFEETWFSARCKMRLLRANAVAEVHHLRADFFRGLVIRTGLPIQLQWSSFSGVTSKLASMKIWSRTIEQLEDEILTRTEAYQQSRGGTYATYYSPYIYRSVYTARLYTFFCS